MRTFTLTLATVLGLAIGGESQAAISLDISSTPGANIKVVGDGTQGIVSFNDSTGDPYAGYNFLIALVSGGAGDSVGLGGNLGGTFTFLNSDITTALDGSQSAVLSSNSGTVTIDDGTGGTFTADIGNSFIFSNASGSTTDINTGFVVNLTNIQYTPGTTPIQDLVAFANAPAGIAQLGFELTVNPHNLTSLASTSNTTGVTSAFSGDLTAVPEPGTIAMAFLAAPLLGLGYYRHRRRTRA